MIKYGSKTAAKETEEKRQLNDKSKYSAFGLCKKREREKNGETGIVSLSIFYMNPAAR